MEPCAGAKPPSATPQLRNQPADDTVDFNSDDLTAALKNLRRHPLNGKKITQSKAEWATDHLIQERGDTNRRVTKTIERLTKGDKRPSD